MARNFIRLRFDESTPLCWRTDGSLVIGYADQPHSAAVRVVQQAREVAVWLSLVDGSRNAAALVASAQAMGISEHSIRLLLLELVEAGHVFEVATVRLPADSQTVARDLRYNGSLHGLAADEVLERRSTARVLVHGAGGLAAAVVARLREQQLRVGWEPNHPGRVRPIDLAGTGLAEPSGSQRWSRLALPLPEPTLVVAIADAHDADVISARFPGAPLLLVTAHRRRVSVGPMLHLASSVCVDCLNAARAENDPDWSFLLTQLLHRHRPLPVLGNPWLALATAQVCAILTESIDTGSIPALFAASLELAPPDPVWRLREWPRQAACPGCEGSDPQQLEQEFRREVADEGVVGLQLAEGG